MTQRAVAWLFVLLLVVVPAASSQDQPAGGVPPDDLEIRALVDRFFATQVAEEAGAYLALWSAGAERPTRAQLKFIFDSGDDAFSDVAIARITKSNDRIRVRVSAMRDRTDTANLTAEGTPRHYKTRLLLALTLVREAGSLRILSEGSPADDLTSALIDAPTADARAALMDADADVPGEMLISSLSRRADGPARSGDFPTAIAIYARVAEVARRLGNTKSEGQALQNIANAEYFQRAFDRALDAYRRRLALERDSGNDEGIGEALVGIATVQYSSFEYVSALATYREAAAIEDRLGDRNALGTTLISTGNVQYLQGDYDGAIADYRRSRDLLHAAFNLAGEARALEGLGRAYTAQGDYAAALDALAGVIAEARARSDEAMLGSAMQSVGDVHFRLANLDTARAAFEESRAHFEAAKDPASVGRAWQALAFTDLAAARFAAAEQEYMKSAAACGTVNDRECMARALVGLAFAQASQEHYDAAVATYKKGIAAFVALKKITEAARAEVGLSDALLGRKEFEQARLAAAHASETAAAVGADDVVWRAQVAQARAWRRLGAPDKAMAVARDAVALVDRLAETAAQNPSQHVSADVGSAYAVLAVLHAEAGNAAGALVALEQRRAAALRAALANNERDIWRGMTLAEREEERALSAAVVSVSVQLDQERSLPHPDAARIDSLRGRIAEAIAARSAHQRRVFERIPDLRRWRGLLPVPELPDLLARIPADTAVVAFAIDNDDLVAVTVSPGGSAVALHASVQPVRRLAVAATVAALASAAQGDLPGWKRAAGDVVSLLPADAVARLAASPAAIVIPDDVLWRVPFEALPVRGGFLGDTTAISYAASLAALQREAPLPAERPTMVVVAAAAPELATDRVERARATSPTWTPRPPESAATEVNRITATFADAKVFVGSRVTESLIRSAGSAFVLHIAAPFAINGASPLFSRVFLSAGESADTSDDGVLETREVFNVDVASRLVVLSDGTAAAMRDAAAAWPIVQLAWSAAGVPALLMARWPSPPACGDRFIGRFYEGLKAGASPAAAAAAAQATLRAHDETRQPACWAGWVLIGAR